MSKSTSLTDKIFNIIMVSPTALTASEIKRALPDAVESSEISTRLTRLVKRNLVFVGETSRRAITGKSTIKCYSAKPVKSHNENNYQQVNIFTLLLQTQ